MSSPPTHGRTVRWTPNDSPVHAAAYPRATSHLISERLTAWLVIVLLVGSAGLALYDLFLLISGLQ
jgi:hypothetical protein